MAHKPILKASPSPMQCYRGEARINFRQTACSQRTGGRACLLFQSSELLAACCFKTFSERLDAGRVFEITTRLADIPKDSVVVLR